MSAILEGELLSEQVSHSMQLFPEGRLKPALQHILFSSGEPQCVSVFRGGLKPELQCVSFSSGEPQPEPQCVSVFRGGLKPELQHVSFSPSELQSEPQCASVFREFHGEGSFYESSRSQGVWID